MLTFQSTHPRGVRHLLGGGSPARQPGFNPRTRVGCDATLATSWRPKRSFNPRTRVGCDAGASQLVSVQIGFQSTHPRGVRRRKRTAGWWRYARFQSTHPRGVRRSCRRCSSSSDFRFNPRTRVGCDWSRHGRGLRCRPCFNPRTRVGCDGRRAGVHPAGRGFQSTHPRGVRPGCSALPVPAPGSFNPRTRVGCDPRAMCRPWPRSRVSIHAPAWGATPLTGLQRRAAYVSIHAPAWGATGRACNLSGPTSGFQSTHPRGVRPLPERLRVLDTSFQSTHPRGVRHVGPMTAHEDDHGFNPRTRVGCDSKRSPVSSTSPMFQSTHPRGVRPDFSAIFWRHSLFQSTHPRGVRLHLTQI